ncbi:MAG: FAD-dependent oxidoreductase [Planctomycetia bacterium]|nr:FAD-dependent oxidoreductase [Planctomycetia bacterium]
MTPAPRGTLVLGAGPAGLAVALGLDGDATVLERRGDVGGLSASLETDGAVLDVGGHSFWTPHPEVRALVLDAVPMVEQRRRAVCQVGDRRIDYPFQRHFGALDAATAARCAAGLASADGGRGAPHLDAFLVGRFGPGIADVFLRPYNRKLWGHDLATLSTDWVGERIASPRPSAGEAGPAARRVPLVEESVVAYPAEGGFGAIFRALAQRLPDVRLRAEVTRVDVVARTVTLADGATLPWRTLVSTLPLTELVARTPAAPADVREAVAGLRAVALRVVAAVVEGPETSDVQRIYVADDRCVAHKVARNHTSSPALRARPRHVIVGEVSTTPDKPPPPGDLAARFVRELVALGEVASPDRVVRTVDLDVRHGYPLPTADRAARVAAVRAWLARHDVHTVGRFGGWAYVNSDACLHEGLLLGRALAADRAGARP